METLEGRQFLSAAPASASPAAATALPGVGVMGDSYSDEYRFYPPDRRTARNYVEQLAAAGRADFGAFTTAARADVRGRGYAFDWAHDGATSDDLLAEGQPAGLAAQVKKGQVSLAWLFVGGDDYLGALSAPDPSAALAHLAGHVLKNIETAAGAVLAAGPGVKLVIATLPDVAELPAVQAARAKGLVSAAVLSQASDSEGQLNAAIKRLAKDARVAVADFAATAASIVTAPAVTVGGVPIDRTTPGDDPHHLVLADGIHLGTVAQGLLANLFVRTADAKFGLDLTPLSKAEILAAAGIKS